MDEFIAYVFIDEHGTEMTEEYDNVLEARTLHAQQEWDPKIGPLRLVRKTYVFTGTYEEI